ncbi:MAG: hypothetical protein R2761_02520 [Acidimicrobiales bacterium]
MGLLGKAMKGGIAKKAFDLARKPENRAKAKEMLRSITGKGGKGQRSSGSVDSAGRH